MAQPSPNSDLLIHLERRELLDINDGKGLAVVCLEGTVWITQFDDPRDIVINAGYAFVLDMPGLALVAAARGPASIAIRKAAPVRHRSKSSCRPPEIALAGLLRPDAT